MFKFVLFLAIAVVAVQGFQPRAEEISRIEANGIIDVIHAAIEKIRDLVSKIDSDLGEIIKNLADRIRQIVERIEESVNELKQKIEEFIRKYGEPAKKCYIQLKPEIEGIVQATRSGILGCIREADEKLATIKGDVADLVRKVVNFQNDVNRRVLKCVKEAQLNVQKLRECLEAQVDPIHEEFVELQKEVDATIEAAKDVVEAAKSNLEKCVNDVKEEVSEKQLELAEHFAKCIADNQ